MLKRHLFLLSLGILVALTSCSRNRANPPEAAIDRTRPLATILIPPVPVPDAMFTDNRSPPVIGWLWVALANTILDKDKSATFDARHAGFRAQAGSRFAEHMRRELAELGFAARLVSSGEALPRQRSAAPGQAPDAVLELRIDTLAMYSRRLDANYLPTLDTSAWLAEVGAREEGLFSNSYIYGAYADRDGNGYLTADPKFAFPSFDALLQQPELVEQSFDEGLRKTARQIARDIRQDFRPAPVALAASRAVPAPRSDAVRLEPANAAKEATAGMPARKKGSGKTSRRAAAG
jgi:hypothetical protein